MKGLKVMKDEKLSELVRDIRHCEMCCEHVIQKLDIYKQVAAEHEWALEQIKMFKTSHQECASLHGLQSGFVELSDKVQDIGLTLKEFKQKLEDAALEVTKKIDEHKKHIEFLKKTCAEVEDITDMDQLEKIDVPWKNWMWSIPDFELNRVAEQWKSMNLIDRLMESLLEQRILIDEVRDKTWRTEEKSEN